jgi:hypothetical protein
MRDMQAFTAAPKESLLAQMLDALHGMHDVLLVLNHPFSDEGRVGHAVHVVR